MLLNDLKKDFRKILVDEDSTQEKVAAKIDTTPQYLGRLFTKPTLLNQMWVKALDSLGYDVQIVYVKRGK